MSKKKAFDMTSQLLKYNLFIICRKIPFIIYREDFIYRIGLIAGCENINISLINFFAVR